jgi:hypothetical protein
MVDAVRGVDSKTCLYCDDAKRYIGASAIPGARTGTRSMRAMCGVCSRVRTRGWKRRAGEQERPQPGIESTRGPGRTIVIAPSV